MAEWLKAHAWKACVGSNVYREFESHPLRQAIIYNSPRRRRRRRDPAMETGVSGRPIIPPPFRLYDF